MTIRRWGIRPRLAVVAAISVLASGKVDFMAAGELVAGVAPAA